MKNGNLLIDTIVRNVRVKAELNAIRNGVASLNGYEFVAILKSHMHLNEEFCITAMKSIIVEGPEKTIFGTVNEVVSTVLGMLASLVNQLKVASAKRTTTNTTTTRSYEGAGRRAHNEAVDTFNRNVRYNQQNVERNFGF